MAIVSALLNGSVSGDSNQQKLLVCAQSNGAIDEILERLSKGLWTDNGVYQKPPAGSIVRTGLGYRLRQREKKVAAFCVETMVEEELGGDWQKEVDSLHAELQELQSRMGKNKSAMEELEKKRGSMSFSDNSQGLPSASPLRKAQQNQEERDGLKKQMDRDGRRIREIKEIIATKQRLRKEARAAKSLELISRARVVCATLSGSGSEILRQQNLTFETVIIDEAAQAVEVATLIPLKNRCRQCILVGDPNQLPATVVSKEASQRKFDQPLFSRLQQAGHKVLMLDIQYRMHPAIAAFPSAHFYQSKLKNGENVLSGDYQKPFHSDPIFPPLAFFDVSDTCEISKGQSVYNKKEALCLLKLLAHFLSSHSSSVTTIGIIAPYNGQRSHILQEIQRSSYQYPKGTVFMVDTVDGFQGREVDVLFFSATRTSRLGFLADVRRLNVALTRPKFGLYIFGYSPLLSSNEAWSALIEHTKKSNCYFETENGDNLIHKSKSAPVKPSVPSSRREMTDIERAINVLNKQPQKSRIILEKN